MSLLYINDVSNNVAANQRIPYLYRQRKGEIVMFSIDIENITITNKWLLKTIHTLNYMQLTERLFLNLTASVFREKAQCNYARNNFPDLLFLSLIGNRLDFVSKMFLTTT